MSDSELRAAFRQAIERAEQSPGAHGPLCLRVAVPAAPPCMPRSAAERCRALSGLLLRCKPGPHGAAYACRA